MEQGEGRDRSAAETSRTTEPSRSGQSSRSSDSSLSSDSNATPDASSPSEPRGFPEANPAVQETASPDDLEAADPGRAGQAARSGEAKRRLTTDVSEASLQLISRLKQEWGLRSRGAVIDRLMAELQPPGQAGDLPFDDGPAGVDSGSGAPSQAGSDHPSPPPPLDPPTDPEHHHQVQSPRSSRASFSSPDDSAEGIRSEPAQAAALGAASVSGAEVAWGRPSERQSLDVADEELDLEPLFNETGALVLVQREGSLEASLDFVEEERPRRRQARSSGIDLPGFVRRNTAQLRRSLHPPAREASHRGDVLPALSEPDLFQALETAAEHWFSLYGQPANEAVIEASMVWLAQDIWTQSDQSEGEAFTWTLAQHLIAPCAPAWQEGPPSLERVIVLAGLLEDPFSASTLSLRIPTLIRRFVHKFRRRRQGASFQTLEHTMTLHGALKLLQIPLDSGQRLTLPLIREAYREMAMNHHPDAGGSVEMMRRLNEAYQLLKELYRNKEA